MRFDFFLQSTFQSVGVGYDIFHRIKFQNQFGSCLFADTGASGNIIHFVAHQGQHVDHLRRAIDAKHLAHFFFAAHFRRLSFVARAINPDQSANQLAQIFVGRHDIGVESRALPFHGQCANHVVGLKAIHFHNRNAISANNVFDVGYRYFNVLRSGFASCLVVRKHLVAKRLSRRIKANGNMRWRLFAQHLFKRIDKTENSRRVHPVGCDAG